MSDPRPSENQDALQLPEMRRRGFFDDVPTLGRDFFMEPDAGEERAETHVEAAEGILRHHGTTSDPHGFALAHAVLAVVEQQRIANLIAFEQISGEKNRAEIRKGLGL